MRIRKELIEADKLLHEASKELHFGLINPTNELSVRKQLMSRAKKNPVFKYTPPQVSLLALRRKISGIMIEEQDLLDSILVEKQRDIIRKIDLINGVGCWDFAERSTKLYPRPSKSLVNKAYGILEKKPVVEKTKNVPAKEAIALFRANFKKFGLNYKIRRAPLVNSCHISAPDHEITLKKKARFSEAFLNRLIVHEIGVHVFRYENASHHKLKVFGHGVANYLETEEGLAAYNEERFGLLRDSVLRNYAGRVLAVYEAEKGSFLEVLRELRKYFDKKTAIQLAMRAKRGMGDTEMPGGYTKDAVYLRGYLDVKKHVKKEEDFERLFAGKISLREVPVLEKLGLKKPRLLPKDFILFSRPEEIQEK